MLITDVKSAVNPADIQQGMKVEELKKSRWFHGPEFLLDHEDNWPETVTAQKPGDTCTSEFKPKKCVDIDACQAITSDDSISLSCFINYFSSWEKLIIATSWLLKYKQFLLKDTQLTKTITVHDLRMAEKSLILHIQKTGFNEFKQVVANKFLGKSSKLKRLCSITQDDMLCVGGRLSQSQWLHVYSAHSYLQTRSKWNQVLPNYKIGFLVLISNESMPRGKWPFAGG